MRRLIHDMTARSILPESSPRLRRFSRPEHEQRRRVLRETSAALETGGAAYHRLGQENLARWSAAAKRPAAGVYVYEGDWGDVTARLTATYGECFAVLNMANAFLPGGAYIEGAPAQEENMFRRTDCHFCVDDVERDPKNERYRPAMTRLISADEGRVFLDSQNPRVCIRGPENRYRDDLGYLWLEDDEIFPFYELRAAAQDLRGGGVFDEINARSRIAAQLETLKDAGIRHAVLSAFGCGAFENPAASVAQLYKEELNQRAGDFDCIAFAIFNPGYGPDNHRPFLKIFGEAGERCI